MRRERSSELAAWRAGFGQELTFESAKEYGQKGVLVVLTANFLLPVRRFDVRFFTTKDALQSQVVRAEHFRLNSSVTFGTSISLAVPIGASWRL